MVELTSILTGIETEEERTEFITRVQEKYAGFFDHTNNYTHSISRMRKLSEFTGVEPSREMLNQIYLSSLEGILSEVDKKALYKLAVEYNLELSEQKVQEMYLRNLEEGRFWGVQAIAEFTGIKPDLEEGVVQESYVKAFEENTYFGHFSDFERFSGIKPEISEELVQEKYLSYLEGTFFSKHRFEELREFSGIEPKIPESEIQKKFNHLLEIRDFTNVRELINILGVKPDEEIVKGKLRELIETGMYDGVQLLRESTGVFPDEEGLIQDKYLKLVKDDMHHAIWEIQRATGIKFRISDEDAQRRYLELCNLGYIHAVEGLNELIGIQPNNEAAQALYCQLIEGDNFDSFEDVEEITGIKPSEEVYANLRDHLMAPEKVE